MLGCCCCCCVWRQALRLQQQLGIAAAECQRVVDSAEPQRSEAALQDLQAKNEALAQEARRCQLLLELAQADAAAASPQPEVAADDASLARTPSTPQQRQARAALLGQPMDSWSEAQVQEWVGVLGLPADLSEVVQRALAADDVNGEDLALMVSNFQGSGSCRPLQKLLKKAQAQDPAALAQQTLALHQAALGAGPAESKLTTARGAADAARAALRRHRVALRSQVVQLVSLASRHFPELRAHGAVRQVSGAFPLVRVD
jgi:hypothetical protein